MKRTLLFLFILSLITLLASVVVLGRDYFLFDLEENKILHMGKDDVAFNKTIDIDKNPQFLMQTGTPDKYLVIFYPIEDKENPQNNIPGKLLIYNNATGKSEDLIELGYSPLKWAYTKDCNQFFITYKSLSSQNYDLLHYNIAEAKAEKLPDFAGSVFDIDLSMDESKILASITDQKYSPQFLNLSYSPLKVESTLALGRFPGQIYKFTNERIALVGVDRRPNIRDKDQQEGTLKLIDIPTNSIIESYKISTYGKTYIDWYEKEKVLMVVFGETSFILRFIGGIGVFKITADSIKYNFFKEPWANYSYLPEKDSLYILTQNPIRNKWKGDLLILNYSDNSISKYETRSNFFDGNGYFYPYQFLQIAGTNLEIMFSPKTGNIRIFDINEKSFIKEIYEPFVTFRTLPGQNAVTCNSDRNKFYYIDRRKDKIVVFDSKFERIKDIIVPDKPIEIYQIEKPAFQTLITTEKTIYRISSDDILVPIDEFNEETTETHLYNDDNKVILWSEKELFVIDAATLNVTDHFNFYIGPNENNSKLETGTQRYYFLRDL